MLTQLVRFFIPSELEQKAAKHYLDLVEKARNPWFFEELGVPDNLDGRFEMIIIHLFAELRKLNQQPENEKFCQALIEAFFDDMDRSLREMGVSDTGVSKRVKKMVEAFYGRIDSYGKAIDDEDENALKAALERNVYATSASDIDDKKIQLLADYATDLL